MRKTLNIQKLLDVANRVNAFSPDDHAKQREGQNFLIDHMLISVGRYNGFRYLKDSDLIGNAKTIDETRVHWS